MAEISAIFSEISHFGPKYGSRGKMMNVKKMQNEILDILIQKFLAYGRNFCHFLPKLFILSISAAQKEK